jgi:hypothetical protein
MPDTKQFEAYTIQDMIFGGKPGLYSMREVSKQFYERIEHIYNYLIEGKTAAIEVPLEDRFYYLKRIDSSTYQLTGVGGKPAESTQLDAIETVNWLFAKAPFISVVGISNED